MDLDFDPAAREYPESLNSIRRAAQAFNILHAHHRDPSDVDNDLYFRIGSLRSDPGAAVKSEIEARLRELLSKMEPLLFEVTLADLSVVSYQDPTLPWRPEFTWRLTEISWSDDFVRRLYG